MQGTKNIAAILLWPWQFSMYFIKRKCATVYSRGKKMLVMIGIVLYWCFWRVLLSILCLVTHAGAERGGARGGHFPGRRKSLMMSQILSSMQNICFRKTSGSNMAASNSLLVPGAIQPRYALVCIFLCICSSVADGGERGEPSPWQAKVKTGPPLVGTFIFSILLVCSRLLFFAFFRGVFVFLKIVQTTKTSRFTIISNLFSECWLVAPLRWAMGPLQLALPPWLKPLVTPLCVYVLRPLSGFLGQGPDFWRRQVGNPAKQQTQQDQL